MKELERNSSLDEINVKKSDGFVKNDTDSLYRDGMKFTKLMCLNTGAIFASLNDLFYNVGSNKIGELQTKMSTTAQEASAYRSRRGKYVAYHYNGLPDFDFVDPKTEEETKKDPLNGRKINEEVVEIFKETDTLVNQAIASHKEGSYARRVLTAAKKTLSYTTREDLSEYMSMDYQFDSFKARYNDFPVPRFRKVNDKGEVTFEYDIDRYEEFMEKHKEFLLIIEDRQNFVENVTYPYYQLKKSGKATRTDEEEYKKAYIDHLERQKSYWDKILQYKKEDLVQIYPFGYSYNNQYEMDWIGERGYKSHIARINKELKYLKMGWAPEDLHFLHEMDEFRRKGVLSCEDDIEKAKLQVEANEVTLQGFNTKLEDAKKKKEEIQKSIDEAKEKGTEIADADQSIKDIDMEIAKYENYIKKGKDALEGSNKTLKAAEEKAKKDIWTPKEREQFKIAYNNLVNTRLTSAAQKAKLVSAFDPFIKKTNGLNKDKGDLQHSTVFKSDVQVKEFNSSVNYVTYQEKNRVEYLSELSRIKKLLSTGHRAGFHKDSADMKGLKENIDKVINKLKDPDYDIYETDEMVDLFKDLAASARGYQNAKKVEAGYDIEDADWDGPSSRMGRTRYEAANTLDKFAKKVSGDIKARRKYNNYGKIMADKGFRVVHLDNLAFNLNNKRDYEIGMINVMNYFSKEPFFIPEHCDTAGNTFTPDNFPEQCKHYDLPEVSNDDFALVAIAAVYNIDVISKDFEKVYPCKDFNDPTKDAPRENSIRYKRGMYINDYFAKNPRADIGISFNDYTLVPARQKAYDIFKSNDLEEMAKVISNGIKEINSECTVCVHIYGNSSNDFANNTELLKRLMDFVKKNPELNDKVIEKLGDEYENVMDTLRLKEYRDKAIDAKLKLERAVKDKKNLSEYEKEECTRDILRMELLDNVRSNARQQMLDENEEYKEFEANIPQIYINMSKPGNLLTDIDVTAHRAALELKVIKPVYKVTKALRNQDGKEELERKLNPTIDKMNFKISEEKLLEQIKETASIVSGEHAKTLSAQAKREEFKKSLDENNKKSKEVKKGGFGL